MPRTPAKGKPRKRAAETAPDDARSRRAVPASGGEPDTAPDTAADAHTAQDTVDSAPPDERSTHEHSLTGITSSGAAGGRRMSD